MPFPRVCPELSRVQSVLHQTYRNGAFVELGAVTKAQVQGVQSALAADPEFAGRLARGCASARETNAYLTSLAAEKP